MLPKYCNTCKLQGHGEAECRQLHPELRVQVLINNQEGYKSDKEDKDASNKVNENTRGRMNTQIWHPTNRRFTMEKNTCKFISDTTTEASPKNNSINTKNSYETLRDEEKGSGETVGQNNIGHRSEGQHNEEPKLQAAQSTTNQPSTPQSSQSLKGEQQQHDIYYQTVHQRPQPDEIRENSMLEGNDTKKVPNNEFSDIGVGRAGVRSGEDLNHSYAEIEGHEVEKALALAKFQEPLQMIDVDVDVELGRVERFPPKSPELLLLEPSSEINAIVEATEKHLILEKKQNSPMQDLHNVITHQITEEAEEGELSSQTEGDIVVDKEEENNQHNLNQMLKNADLSPQTNTKGRKGKTKADCKPTRIVPKRSRKANSR
uniref:Uncharacterized protein n=1 Tax=Solanum tuberosum TaxID=4113 RepID=M1DZL1_SOLTU